MIDDDDDNDGYADSVDDCPTQGSASFPDWIDSDGDGLCDNTDTDDDNDGVFDANDVFPNDANETVDWDGDGIGDNGDTDDETTVSMMSTMTSHSMLVQASILMETESLTHW